MKKKHILFILICILSVLVLIVLQFTKETLLTGDESDIAKVTILEPKRITVNDQTASSKIYELIKATHNIGIERYPSHSASLQSDSRFEIKITYKDGKSDLIQSTENKEYVYRHLGTKGSSGDAGYIGGLNEHLWEYIYQLTGVQ